MSLQPTTPEKDELILTMLSMLRDLHENFGWDELSSTLEEVEEAAAELGVSPPQR